MFVATILFLIFGPLFFSTSRQPTSRAPQSGKVAARTQSRAYLGFDANEYPGDAALPALKHTFAFAGFWLNPPPGAKSNSWTGKRSVLLQNGFGFLVLFNGRMESQLKPPVVPGELGTSDADLAVKAAQREGFPAHTVIFLDQEEGGRMLPVQIEYLSAWIHRVNSAGYAAGVYCSGMKVKEGKNQFIITADDIRDHTEAKYFFVYNDACPPSPGCVYLKTPPEPSASGIAYAAIWQFAQSPRRQEFTKGCSNTYNHDDNCYPPAISSSNTNPASVFLDLDTAASPDPSSGRD